MELIKNPPFGFKFYTEKIQNQSPITKIVSKYRNSFYKEILYKFGSIPYLIAQFKNNNTNFNQYDLNLRTIIQILINMI